MSADGLLRFQWWRKIMVKQRAIPSLYKRMIAASSEVWSL